MLNDFKTIVNLRQADILQIGKYMYLENKNFVNNLQSKNNCTLFSSKNNAIK